MHALAKDLGHKIVPGSVWFADAGSERGDVTVQEEQEAFDLAAKNNDALLDDFRRIMYFAVHFKTDPLSTGEKRRDELNVLLDGVRRSPEFPSGMHSASDAQLTAGEEEVWIDYGHNGCHCGLTREGSDGRLALGPSSTWLCTAWRRFTRSWLPACATSRARRPQCARLYRRVGSSGRGCIGCRCRCRASR